MLLGEAIPRAPSLHRGGRHQARRPRLERGDAPARGTRRGSTEGMAPWRHLTNRRKNPGRARDGRWRSPPSHRTGRTRDGWEHPARGNEVARSPVSTRDGEDHPGRYTAAQAAEWARPATVVSVGDHREISRQRATARRGQTRTEAGASRGGGFTARGRARASKCVADIGRQPQAQRSPFETPGDLAERRAARSPAPTRVTARRAADGQAGARSRVNLSDGIARCSPGRSRRQRDCRSDHSVDVHGEHPGRKAWVGIDLALGSPSVLSKEGTPDCPLAPSLHGRGVMAVSARATGGAVV